MRAHGAKYFLFALAAVLVLAPSTVLSTAGVKPTFLYSLANFHGKLPYNEVRVRVDRARGEIYVVERGIVRVFNESGMEFFWFGDNAELESIYDLAVDEKGDVSLLSFNFSHPEDPKYFLIRCNYRGELKEKLTVTGLPVEYSGFFPNYMFYRDGEYLFLSSSKMQVVVTEIGRASCGERV